MADKSNCQILYGNGVCRRSICFVKAGITIYFVKVINIQVIIGTLIFYDIMFFENPSEIFSDFVFGFNFNNQNINCHWSGRSFGIFLLHFSIYKPPYEIVTGDLSSENSCSVKMVIESMNFQKCRNSFCEMKYLRYRSMAPKEYRKYAFHQFSTGILKLQCDSQLHVCIISI